MSENHTKRQALEAARHRIADINAAEPQKIERVRKAEIKQAIKAQLQKRGYQS